LASKVNKNKVITAAQKFVQKGQYDKAIREYTKIVEDDPREVRIWLKIGDLHAKKNSNKEAIDTYAKVAEFYSEQGFYLKAVAVYKQILKLDSSMVDHNLRLAELYKQLGLLSDAMQQYEQVSNFYHQSGKTKEALEALRQIVDLDPENVASRIKLAELYSKENMREEAVTEFSKAADFLRSENRLEDLIKVAERLVYHKPEDVEVTKELAEIYLRKQDPRRALQKLQLAFKSNPRDEQTLEMLAQAFEDLEQTAKTISVLKELANIHAENGQHAKQQVIFQRVLRICPTDEDALRVLQAPPSGGPNAEALPPPILSHPAAPPSYFQDAGHLEVPGPTYSFNPHEGQIVSVDDLAPSVDVLEGGEDYSSVEGLPASEDYQSPEAFFAEPLDDQPYAEAPEHLDEDEHQGELITYGAAPKGASTFQEGTLEEVGKIIAEADVYIKYHLLDKAIDHLRQGLNFDPQNHTIHHKLKELYISTHRYAEAVSHLIVLAQLYLEAEPQQAAQLLKEVLQLDPANVQARQLLEHVENADEENEWEDEDTSSALSLESDDIVEEIQVDSADFVEGIELTPLHTLSSQGEEDEEEARPREDTVTDLGGKLRPGLIEVEGESLGKGTSRSEVIDLGGEGLQLDNLPRVHLDEVTTNIEDDLEEAEFFIQQGLLGEAHGILDELLARLPNNPLVRAKVAELQEAEGKQPFSSSAAAAARPSSRSAVDLTAELEEEFDEIDKIQLPAEQEAKPNYSVEDVFEELKRGGGGNPPVDEDLDTHYDLGIAYREMGLLDDAINEFRVAMRSRDKEVLCHMMIGLCYLEKEMLSEAISQFKTGLYVEGITERETIALYFELGQSYEHLEDLREALYYYEKVAKKDPTFREVEAKIQTIEQNQHVSTRIGSSNGGNPHPPP
jgi:tetratricopeptide (TPR) repeat protein